jgi:hypothetical protein
MLDSRGDRGILKGKQLIQVAVERDLPGLSEHPAPALAPHIDLIRQDLLAFAQGSLFSAQRPALVLCPLEHHAPDFFQAFARRDELALNFIRLAVESLLDLAQSEPDHRSLPPASRSAHEGRG